MKLLNGQSYLEGV